ncbi:MAG: Tat (twin-arginine translocation) pathway signal sequence [Cutibacterium avidum]|uniref:hypothetical protein n=1 Tax=Cutibacterium avidum TaxID=33010 RepID=UPI00056879EA|nr:hypothetical protein [Cutibacterium avidum]MCG7369279.1 Tat (twin-arginine translocation) pathway signal sequence [Cutibacterium avidum]MDU4920931.1 Tat (twin-arginine translocation) pathway signal sequence [Cutibacterium avidum]MDU7386189.1 Tat (twin-arginine translocation) pathway signal sequence [Cutibacterium avidum]MDY0817081.1 Tat (twin-arginine translocation) pathway signal sequence [Cutibacterium avidum]
MTMKARGPITRRRLVLGTCVASAAAVMSPAFTLESNAAFGKSTTMWNESMGDALKCFPVGGGYHTGRDIPPGFQQTAWTGLDRSVGVSESGVEVNPQFATPSFCSSAVYLLLLKSIEMYEKSCGHVLPEKQWEYLKPYTVENRAYPIQADGVGAWGRANANGPGLAELVHELGIGTNMYIGTTEEYINSSDRNALFASIRKFDYMKIFWNDEIGKDESGHMVVVLGRSIERDQAGHSVGLLHYWSSNGSHTDINGGYGIKCVSVDKIHRAVITRIDWPWKLWSTEVMRPDDVCAPLAEIAKDRSMTPEEMKRLVDAKSFWPRRVRRSSHDTDAERSMR